MMDRIQQRVIEIALQVPEYIGYQAKDRRREEDKLVRRQLAGKYGEQQTRLNRVARRSPLEYVVDIENLDQKLQRLVARLNTAPPGYAGWFDAAQIAESDLDQLTAFDAGLTGGVNELGQSVDAVQAAVQARGAVSDAIAKTADLLDDLNARFDQRDQFLAMGKRPTPIEKVAPPASPLGALMQQKGPSPDLLALSTLKLKDAISYRGADYIVNGKITFAAAGDTFWAFLLQGGAQETWLHVGPSEECAVHHPAAIEVASPSPDSVEFQRMTFSQIVAGAGTATIEGISGRRTGQVSFALFSAADGTRLWTEQYATESRTTIGQVVDPSEIRTYRR